MKILVVDDEQINLSLLTSSLKLFGYNVATHKDGVKALDWINSLEGRGKRMPHLIVSDVYMPGLSGIELLKQLKLKESTKNIVVMMMSACDDTMNVEQCKTLGAVDFLVKPLQEQKVKEKINIIMTMLKLKELADARLN